MLWSLTKTKINGQTIIMQNFQFMGMIKGLGSENVVITQLGVHLSVGEAKTGV